MTESELQKIERAIDGTRTYGLDQLPETMERWLGWLDLVVKEVRQLQAENAKLNEVVADYATGRRQ